MSGAFVKESDDQWLHDISPTMGALINYLTRENSGIRVYEKMSYVNPENGKLVHEMSNGSHYSIGDDSKWYIFK